MDLDIKLPLAIVGMGKTGRSLLRLLLEAGIPRHEIFTFDQKEDTVDISSWEDLASRSCATWSVSPGIDLRTPEIESFRRAGGRLTSELELATRFLTTEKRVAVTGSVGKSTVTSLIGHGLKGAGIPHFVGGNLGTPLADYAFSVLKGLRPVDWVVLELSSYQIENYENMKFDGAVFTRFTPNHLERYDSLESYYKTKLRLGLFIQGALITCEENRVIFQNLAAQGFSFVSKTAVSADERNRAQLVGDHNYENLSLAWALAEKLAWPLAFKQATLGFRGLEHRLENLGIYDGIRFINDSKATTITSVIQAVHSVENLCSGQLWLLVGGKDKNLPWRELSVLNQPKMKFVFFGEVRQRAQTDSGLPGKSFGSFYEIFSYLKQQCQPDDLVLLSPGGVSQDEFKSFEHRGDVFKSQILQHWSAKDPRSSS